MCVLAVCGEESETIHVFAFFFIIIIFVFFYMCLLYVCLLCVKNTRESTKGKLIGITVGDLLCSERVEGQAASEVPPSHAGERHYDGDQAAR